MKLTLLVLTGLLMFSFTSCGLERVPSFIKGVKQNPYSLNVKAASTNFRILVTDDPFTYDKVKSAKVTINKVALRNQAKELIVLSEESVTIDLVPLRNGNFNILLDREVAHGIYEELILYFSEAVIVLKDSREFKLTIPAGAKNGVGIEISSGMLISEKVGTDLLLDFDLSRSFLPLGDDKNLANVSGFDFFPVIRAAFAKDAGALGGIILSSEGSPLVGAVVEAKGGTLFSTAITDENGFYAIVGLLPGDYKVIARAHDHQANEALSVTVKVEAFATAPTIILVK